MQLKDLQLENRSKTILTRLIIHYWEEDNNISYCWRNRTEAEKNQFDNFWKASENGTLDLTPLIEHQDTLFVDLRKARNCGMKSFKEISKELEEKMGLFEIINKNDLRIKKIREIIKYACYDETSEETIRKIKEVLENE